MIMVNEAGGYAEMGKFNAADRWKTAILFVPSLLGSVTLPMLASLRGESASRRYRNLLWTNIRLGALAAFAVSAPIVLLAPWIMASYGPEFVGGAWVLIVLCTSAVASAACWIVTQALVSQGHLWTMFLLNLGWACTLLASIWLLRGYGSHGLACAYLIAEAVRLCVGLLYVNRICSADGR
jgi:O-antigen/teichoic acid export membrane protein